LGVKPLFYYYHQGMLAFASEIKALKLHPMVKSRLSLNDEAVAAFLQMGYIPQPHTIYNEIHKFPAGNFAVLESQLHFHKYWTFADQITPSLLMDEYEAEEKLETLLHSAIKYRLIADVPVGVFLSGGIDSSLVTALASKYHSGKIKSFTIGFKDGKFDESKHALKVAQHLNTEHHELIIEEKEVFENLDNIFDIYDEPFGDQSMLPSLAVCKLARAHVKVVLTGDGGDEFFYGYGAYTWAQRLQNPFFKQSHFLLSKILSIMPARYKRVAELLDYDGSTHMESHIHAKENGYYSSKELKALMHKSTSTFRPYTSHITARPLQAIEKQALFDAEVYLRDDLLVKMDRASMHHGLEAREPLLDFRIVELALNLDVGLKKRDHQSKYLLKKILYKHVPQQLLERPKWGFTIPLNAWLNKDLAYLKDEYLNKEIVALYGIVKFSKVQDLLKSYNHKPYQTQQVWALILLHKWLKEQY
ncbi:MAG TPA: asparagine synthase (glutamine-hydrolyzing), partial [Cytophagales bacterium]|nr:asparagine synthase (glutamine-hydrolyzing) [Cytophagales bacterium]